MAEQFKDRVKKMVVKTGQAADVTGSYDELKDWRMDPKGYFLIRVDRTRGVVEVGHCGKLNTVDVKITGRTPQEIYFTACEQGLLSRLDHAAYLGKELAKAFLALKHGWMYVQDEELDTSTPQKG